MSRKLPRSFYNRPTLKVARDLLGTHLVFRTEEGRMAARIVEVEAYIGQDDPACHAAPGPTDRNRVMYGKPGFSYVYFVYGMYHCFNVVTEAKGYPAAVLIRAAEPVDGVGLLRHNSPKSLERTILSGPGKLCRAFGLTTHHSAMDLTGTELFLTEGSEEVGAIVCSERIGIKKGTELPYRFFLEDSGAVSGPKAKSRVTGRTR
jgi:DNA-3-methyladenine glycosylase